MALSVESKSSSPPNHEWSDGETSEIPNGVLCAESSLDPVKNVIPVILNLIVERADVRQTVYSRIAGGNAVNQAIGHNEIFILAGSEFSIILLAVGDKLIRPHRCNEDRDADNLQRAGSGIVRRTYIDLVN